MRRRDFLKGIFGAAAVAAVPAVVLKQIDSLPEESISQPLSEIDAVGKIYTGPIEHIISITPEEIGVLYIYDEREEQLIAASTNFRVDMFYKVIRLDSLDDEPLFVNAPPLWSVSAEDIQWKVDPTQVFDEGKVLKCLMAKDNIKYCGDVYLTELVGSGSFGAYLRESWDAKFTGTRELMMIIQKG